MIQYWRTTKNQTFICVFLDWRFEFTFERGLPCDFTKLGIGPLVILWSKQ
jgi:hypothetical protein